MADIPLNPETDTQCKYCAEPIKKEALICRHCGYNQQTGKPADFLIPVKPVPQSTSSAKTKSTVGDGVRLGCGMFIVLPLILFIIIVVIIIFAAASGS